MREVVVVGAGPAGASACDALEDRGVDPVLLDREEFPREKPCAGVLPHRIHRILDLPDYVVSRPLRGYRLHPPSGDTLEVPFPVDGAVVDRRGFDAHLVDRLDTTVETREVTDARIHGDRVELECGGETLEARWVVAADGALSTVRRGLGVRYPETAAAHQYRVRLPEEEITERVGNWFHVHYSFTRGYGWVSALRDSLRVGVGGLGEDTGREGLREFFEELSEGPLRDAEVEAEESHAIPMAGPLDPPSEGRVLFAGDAGGFVYPGTGEGVFYGIRSGRAAAETIAADPGRESSVETVAERYVNELRSRGLLSLRDVSFLDEHLSSPDSAERYVRRLGRLLA